MDDNNSEIQAQAGAWRQYGGYGNYGGYGGFVECCEGVVDPLLLLSIILGEKIRLNKLNKIPFHRTKHRTLIVSHCLTAIN